MPSKQYNKCGMEKIEPELAGGFTCSCGKYKKYSPYVYAHWTIELQYTCECGKKYSLLEGVCEEI